MQQPTVGPGLCECGCGQPTRLAYRSDTARGWRKGEPMRFINGHAVRLARKPFESQFEVLAIRTNAGFGRAPQMRTGTAAFKTDASFAERIAWHSNASMATSRPDCSSAIRATRPAASTRRHLFEGTAADNTADMVAKGRCSRTAPPGACKVTLTQAKEIRRRYAAGGITQCALGADYGLSQSAVSLIVLNKMRRT